MEIDHRDTENTEAMKQGLKVFRIILRNLCVLCVFDSGIKNLFVYVRFTPIVVQKWT